MSLFRNSRGIAIWTSKLWHTTVKCEETKGRSALVGFREEIGKGCWHRSSLEKSKNVVVAVSYWLQVAVSVPLLGQVDICLTFLKSRR